MTQYLFLGELLPVLPPPHTLPGFLNPAPKGWEHAKQQGEEEPACLVDPSTRRATPRPSLPATLTPSRHVFQPDASRRYRSTFSATASPVCAASAGSIAPCARLGVHTGFGLQGERWAEAETPRPGPSTEPRPAPLLPSDWPRLPRPAPPRAEIGRTGSAGCTTPGRVQQSPAPPTRRWAGPWRRGRRGPGRRARSCKSKDQ